MKSFYKINIDKTASIGTGETIPNDFIEYKKGSEPKELLDALDYITPETQAQSINNAIQIHLDTKAQSLRYDNINAIGKYVGYENDFQAEAEALGVWASSCWKVAGEIEADVKAGNRDMPTVDEVLTELPTYEGI